MNFLLFIMLSAFSMPAGTMVYKDATAKFTLSYPADWEKQDMGNLNTIAFLRPKAADDYFQENVNIVKEDLSAQPVTLSQLTDIIREQTKAMQGFGKLISEKPVLLAGQNATEMIYTVNMDPLKIKVVQTWFIKNNVAYIITYTGTETNFEKYLSVAKAIKASFKFY